MRILVSGSEGFIASHLIPKLKELGHDVTGMDIKVISPTSDNWLHSEDIRSYPDCLVHTRNIDCVVHLAAFIDVQESLRDKMTYCQNNIQGTVNLLEASRANGVKRFIFASSAAADSPQSPYGVTKLCGEYWCDIFNKCYGLSTISLRFFNVYGKGTDKGVIPTWIKAVKLGNGIKVNGGKQVRDFIYVSDIVDAIIHTINIEDVGVYEVGTGKGTQLWGDLVPTLERVMEKEFSWVVDKPPENETQISVAYTTEESMDYRETGWKPKYTLEQGLREMQK
jgi:UDP-glucose 4-epimerase